MNKHNQSDLLYLYGFFRISIRELKQLKPTPVYLSLLKVNLELIGIYEEVNTNNYMKLTFGLWVKQGTRRSYLDFKFILWFYSELVKFGCRN